MAPKLAADGGAARPTIRLPDPLRNWPWPRFVSPYYEECKRESDEWFEGFNAFSQKAQVAFVKCNFSTQGPDHLKSATHRLMHPRPPGRHDVCRAEPRLNPLFLRVQCLVSRVHDPDVGLRRLPDRL